MTRWMLVLIAIWALLFSRPGTGVQELSESDDEGNLTDGGSSDIVYDDDIDDQLEDLWVSEVIERAADRTIDEISTLDLMVTGLLAVQATIYAILIDKGADFSWWPVPALFIVGIAVAAINLCVVRGRKVPNPEAFHEVALQDTQLARRELIAALLKVTGTNEQRLFWKRVLFLFALFLTVVASVLAPGQAHPRDVAPKLYRVIGYGL